MQTLSDGNRVLGRGLSDVTQTSTGPNVSPGASAGVMSIR